MKHPSEATLALLAGNDLGLLRRWQAERHLAGCPPCRKALEEFEALRGSVIGLRDLPNLPWGRLATEMKANIRVGLEAGECVREGRSVPLLGQAVFPGWRALIACVSAVALVATGIVLERPVPGPAAPAEGMVLRATANGIELSEDGQVLSLLHRRAPGQDVTYTVGAQGSLEARYVDADSGYVTVNNVYSQ